MIVRVRLRTHVRLESAVAAPSRCLCVCEGVALASSHLQPAAPATHVPVPSSHEAELPRDDERPALAFKPSPDARKMPRLRAAQQQAGAHNDLSVPLVLESDELD